MKNTNIQAGDIFHQAVRFLVVSKLLKTEIESLMENDKALGQLLIVYFVNLSFSCELYLKSLINNKDVDCLPNTHNLKKLFNKLEALDEGLGSDIKSQVASSVGMDIAEFGMNLEKSSNVFEDWRYVYENPTGKKVKVAFLEELARVTEQRLLEEHPGWQPAFRGPFKI